MTNLLKSCSRCKISKPREEFKGHTYCSPCWFEYMREYRRKNKEKIKLKDRQWRHDNKEHLSRTQKERWKNNTKYRERARTYRVKHADNYRKYKENRKEKRKEEFKAWYTRNREKNIERSKQYARKNRKKIAQRKRERRATDIQYRLNEVLRDRLKSVIKGKLKAGSAVRDLGCTLAQLINYLESKFLPGMTWDNHGFYGWHIDHVKPLASFDLSNTEQFREAAHYSNLQPLWAKDNISKGKKW